MNSDFKKKLSDAGYNLIEHCPHFPPHGKTYFVDSEESEGFYWIYETDHFLINIHDSYIKNDYFTTFNLEDFSDFFAFSSFIKSAHGELLSPYIPLHSNSSFILMNQKQEVRFLLHGNSYFHTIEIDFKKSMIEEYLTTQFQLEKQEINKIFTEFHPLIANKLEKLADEIRQYRLNSIGSELFYEIKAKEWLSIIINEYYHHQGIRELSEADDRALNNVKNYIDDHFSMDIPQTLLAKIAMMSKTKLKSTFKLKYKMTLTEYIQRRRMTIAEKLLVTTHIEIKDIALSVGYQSHSRFSSLFKKYVGLYPHEIRKKNSLHHSNTCDCFTQLKQLPS